MNRRQLRVAQQLKQKTCSSVVYIQVLIIDPRWLTYTDAKLGNNEWSSLYIRLQCTPDSQMNASAESQGESVVSMPTGSQVSGHEAAEDSPMP